MAININNELFKRYAPKKKIEIIENLTSSELMATTPATMERIIKEAGRYQYKSVDKRPTNMIWGYLPHCFKVPSLISF